MISLGFWIAGLLGKTITQQQAKRLGLWVGIPLALVAAVLLFVAGKALYDRGVVEQFKDKQEAKAATDVLKADRVANENAQQRAEVAEAENERLENAMADAKLADPAKGQTEVGPVQQSYFDTLPKKRR
ncbi:hypothetical protein [Sphingomonas phage Carli]|nr:hypothetical protein [Sphingomonas phage Carli]